MLSPRWKDHVAWGRKANLPLADSNCCFASYSLRDCRQIITFLCHLPIYAPIHLTDTLLRRYSKGLGLWSRRDSFGSVTSLPLQVLPSGPLLPYLVPHEATALGRGSEITFPLLPFGFVQRGPLAGEGWAGVGRG